jgi:hypothetical protein
MSRIRSSLALLVACVWALGLAGTALAADMGMPVKAPPPPPPAPPPSWWSGFVIVTGESFLINPQGQALIPHGTVSLVAGLDLDLYKDKAGFINDIKVGGLLATDWSHGFDGYWAGGEPSANGTLFDTVFILSQSVTFGQYWTLSNQYVNVYSNDTGPTTVPLGPGIAPVCTGVLATTCSAFTGFTFLNFDQIKLAFNDSFDGWWITFNPYVAFYYEWNGAGTAQPACFTCLGNAGDWFLGIEPTVSLEKYWGIPVTLKAPTYVTVGQTSFWGGGLPTPFWGHASTASNEGVGIFTTGLTAVIPFKFMPAQYGHWFIQGGVQFYDVINTSLQSQNVFSVCGPAATSCSNSQYKDIVVGFVGIGAAF